MEQLCEQLQAENTKIRAEKAGITAKIYGDLELKALEEELNSESSKNNSKKKSGKKQQQQQQSGNKKLSPSGSINFTNTNALPESLKSVSLRFLMRINCLRVHRVICGLVSNFWSTCTTKGKRILFPFYGPKTLKSIYSKATSSATKAKSKIDPNQPRINKSRFRFEQLRIGFTRPTFRLRWQIQTSRRHAQ